MANLTETSRWEAGIYQLETSDPVMGGPNGIDNRPTRELANRTLWLKNEIAKAMQSIGTNKTAADGAIALKADAATVFTAGAGLTGGGSLAAGRSFALATPSTLNGSTANWVGNGATGHTHELSKATPTLAGVAKLVNALDSSATDAAVSAAMAKKLQEEKLGNSGNQTLNGQLGITRNAWEKMRFTNSDGSFWRFESAPIASGENGARFNWVFTGNDSQEVGRVSFPRVSGGETAAYQSWVQTALDNKTDLKTVDYYADKSSGYKKSGFYRSNGHLLDDKSLPSMEIHIAHPSYQGNQYARGIGFDYGGSFGLTTTAWDKDGFYVGKKTILTEENGVMLTGNQTISGVKTFSARPDFAAGIRFSTANKEGWGELGMGPADIYMRNPASSKVLQLKDDGTLAYSNDKIMLASDKSDAVNLADSNKLATAVAVKTAYDLGSTALQAANQAAPAGTISYFAGDTPPAGWLAANGAAISRAGFPHLFAAIGTRYGAGDGRSTFNLPDLRGEFVRSWDAGRGVDSGRALGSWQGDEIKSHRHVSYFGENPRAYSPPEGYAGTGIGSAGGIDGDNAYPYTSATGGAETRPRNIALLACIKA